MPIRSIKFSHGETFIFGGNPDIECIDDPLRVFEKVAEINRRVLTVMTMRLEKDLDQHIHEHVVDFDTNHGTTW